MVVRILSALIAAVWLGACATPASGLRVEGNRLFIPVALNGVETEALLDSGAEMTLVDTVFAVEAGLAAFGADEVKGTGAGTQSVAFAEGVNFAAAGRTLEGQVVAILDLTDISERVVGHPLTVIAGRELFDAGRFEVDISRRVMREVTRSETPRGDLETLSDEDGIKQVGIVINGVAVRADFDLGNGNEVLLSRAFAEQLHLLTPETIIGTKEGGGIGGPVELTLVRLARLEIAGLVLTDVTAAISPSADGAKANVGVSVLRNFGLVIDFPENRIWLERRD